LHIEMILPVCDGICGDRRAREQKNGPRVYGGQVALVLSLYESFFGGRTAG
jgi:hypothetical protein